MSSHGNQSTLKTSRHDMKECPVQALPKKVGQCFGKKTSEKRKMQKWTTFVSVLILFCGK